MILETESYKVHVSVPEYFIRAPVPGYFWKIQYVYLYLYLINSQARVPSPVPDPSPADEHAVLAVVSFFKDLPSHTDGLLPL